MTDHPIAITLAEQAARTGRTSEMMAAAIKGRIECLGSCERQDLLRDGFDPRDVAWYWREACDIAGVFNGEMTRTTTAALPEAAAVIAFIGFIGCVGLAFVGGGA